MQIHQNDLQTRLNWHGGCDVDACVPTNPDPRPGPLPNGKGKVAQGLLTPSQHKQGARSVLRVQGAERGGEDRLVCHESNARAGCPPSAPFVRSRCQPGGTSCAEQPRVPLGMGGMRRAGEGEVAVGQLARHSFPSISDERSRANRQNGEAHY